MMFCGFRKALLAIDNQMNTATNNTSTAFSAMKSSITEAVIRRGAGCTSGSSEGFPEALGGVFTRPGCRWPIQRGETAPGRG